MRLFTLITFFCLVFTTISAEIIKPTPYIEPENVISIQLSALQENNNPYENAGIVQTWEFAHPSNRKFTGPIEKFGMMMYSPAYIIMLNHNKHNIIEIEINENSAFFFIELIDKNGNQYGFRWILEKVFTEGNYKDCWMTISVSPPMLLSKST
ncbi:MAG: hypothetical protein CFH18_00114 [Alphaproteobacteria bacterium MarineAlpha5_Bin8]|nr:MAG: hypothetical protein CFH17_00772 [Alphaproteobacteria bacterium MarineAlpha5_Bin7]PPR48304.1 MAG: hypothetical protein CFH18_00114 [Alphaproteobacteria bacterium MarineAlpha5_Bin8]PPR53780.1 MAG: hypothetical protein CFH16_00813 [Alphaproteobacteria bacterium MarineAlpha5_Bin6]|tara:strand:- start:2502 stop:2960 length:459 start_codon:yes stop_codon:yes gene_type:complete